MKTLWLHAGARMPVDVSTNVKHSDMLATWVWPGHHDWHVVLAHKHPCVFRLYCHVHTHVPACTT